MRTLEQWFKSNDEVIKQEVEKLALKHNVEVIFEGYYIEGNDRWGSFPPQPFYPTFKDYRLKNKYELVSYVRYFFTMKNDKKVHTITVSLACKDWFEISFSIEELGAGEQLTNQDRDLNSDDFIILHQFISKKTAI